MQSDTSQTVYTLTLDELQCPVNCMLQCKKSQICIHTYSCTCPDSLVTGSICKHIHLVARNNNHCASASAHTNIHRCTSGTSTNMQAAKVDTDDVVSHLSNHGKNEIQQRLTDKMSSITVRLGTCSESSLKAIEKHINAVIGLIDRCRL